MALTKTKTKYRSKSKLIAPQGLRASLQNDGDLEMQEGSTIPANFDPDRDLSNSSKDETEKTLEKLVFGDDEGFIQSLRAGSSSKGKELTVRRSSEDDTNLQDDENMEALDDADLFFLDSGPGEIPSGISAAFNTRSSSVEDDRQGAVWWDSDDDRLVVSLASNSQLRKLRHTEDEHYVGGREYIRRLREQYERLHSRPSWAHRREGQPQNARKKRRSIGSESDVDSDSDLNMAHDSVEDELNSMRAKPLAALLRNTQSIIDLSAASKASRFKLRKEVIDIHKLKDITSSSPAAINALSFHKIYPILLATAGSASTVYIHHVSPHSLNPNPLLTSLYLKSTPLHSVEFRSTPKQITTCGPEDAGNEEHLTQIYLSSRRRHMHTWNLYNGHITQHTRPMYGDKSARASQRTLESFHLSPGGKYIAFIGSGRKGGGVINVLDASTMQWLCACRVDGRGGISDFAWWRDGDGMAILSKSGEVSEFSLGERRVIGRWVDEGNVGPTVIVLGGWSGQKGGLLGSDRWVATGSTSGIVNIYDRSTWGRTQPKESVQSTGISHDLSDISISSNPSPTRTMDQLTTPISSLTFSPDGQVLIMASRWKRDALRLVHLPSCTVFRNWPTAATPLGRVTSTAITSWGGQENGDSSSDKGMWLCIGNEKGRIGMWEIRA